MSDRVNLEPYVYAAQCTRVVDGDTIDVLIDFGFKLRQEMRLRLADINTPELREGEPGLAAKQFVMERLFGPDGDPDDPKPVELRLKMRKTRKGDERRTFGRYVAEVYFLNDDGDFDDLNALLVAEGHAVMSKG